MPAVGDTVYEFEEEHKRLGIPATWVAKKIVKVAALGKQWEDTGKPYQTRTEPFGFGRGLCARCWNAWSKTTDFSEHHPALHQKGAKRAFWLAVLPETEEVAHG